MAFKLVIKPWASGNGDEFIVTQIPKGAEVKAVNKDRDTFFHAPACNIDAVNALGQEPNTIYILNPGSEIELDVPDYDVVIVATVNEDGIIMKDSRFAHLFLTVDVPDSNTHVDIVVNGQDEKDSTVSFNGKMRTAWSAGWGGTGIHDRDIYVSAYGCARDIFTAAVQPRKPKEVEVHAPVS